MPLHSIGATNVAQTLDRTALYETHVSLGAKMVPFAGWEMPIQYQGILAEARAVRSSSGLFDVSHMGRIWVRGLEASALLDWLVTADVAGLPVGRGRYTFVCTQEGGILDDAIVYNLGEQQYLLVCNAANRGAVWGWLAQWRDVRFPDTMLVDMTTEVGMIAFQGPRTADAMNALAPGLAERLRPFRCAETQVEDIGALVARTGYTGEDGFEIMPSAKDGPALWRRLVEMGAVSCGLGARDVLRLEAGLLLHGSDMDARTNPFEAGLERFVDTNKESVWSEALMRVSQQGVKRKLTGFQMMGRGVARHGYPILADGTRVGEVTSGNYSPTLDRYIGLGYVSVSLASPGSRFSVDIRGKLVEAEAVHLPFYSRRRS
ncbi:MAG: glycine cleavage system aminomethyltransferase GcvT [Chloroflexi bacterium]|nr:glycine cleavage system aminomethyltransferase GcvT [Chloroflexota bacterium]